MSFQNHGLIGTMCVLVSILAALSGCATMTPRPAIKAGDEVTVQYTCRLKSGEVAASTDKEIGEDPSAPKAKIFVPWTEDELPNLVAGSGDGGWPGLGKLIPFRTALQGELTKAMLGLGMGEEHTVEIQGRIPPGLTEADRFQTYKRSRLFPKERRMTWEDYRKHMGEEIDPEVGQEYFSIGPTTGKVVAVTEDEVVVRVSVQEGGRTKMQLGTGVYHDKGDQFEIYIDVHEGELVRTGYLVGRTVRVDDERFTIDYGDPLGGETLVCHILAEPADPESLKQDTEEEDVRGE